MEYEDEVEDDEVLVVLKHIQRLEPIGIGSRNWRNVYLFSLKVWLQMCLIGRKRCNFWQHYELLIWNEFSQVN